MPRAAQQQQRQLPHQQQALPAGIGQALRAGPPERTFRYPGRPAGHYHQRLCAIPSFLWNTFHMIEAVVFDLDGVLIDSETVWDQVRRDLVQERGGTWLPEAQKRLMGMSTQEWARYLHDELGVDLEPEQIASTIIERMAARYAEHLPIMPGADDTIRHLGQRRRLALASSSPRELIDTVLVVADWTRLFEVTVSTEEIGHGKPAPDVYLAAVRQLDVAPGCAVAVEDSTNGLRSAAAAGLHVIAIPQPQYPPSAEALNNADSVLGSLSELSDAVIESVG